MTWTVKTSEEEGEENSRCQSSGHDHMSRFLYRNRYWNVYYKARISFLFSFDSGFPEIIFNSEDTGGSTMSRLFYEEPEAEDFNLLLGTLGRYSSSFLNYGQHQRPAVLFP